MSNVSLGGPRFCKNCGTDMRLYRSMSAKAFQVDFQLERLTRLVDALERIHVHAGRGYR